MILEMSSNGSSAMRLISADGTSEDSSTHEGIKSIHFPVITANRTKLDYIMSKLMATTIVVKPSSLAYEPLKDKKAKVSAELSRIKRARDMSESLAQCIQLLSDVFHELGERMPKSPLDAETAIIEGMERR